MPKGRRDSVPPKSKREELLNAILGPDEEMDDELAEEILGSHGITSSELVREFKLRLQAELHRHYDETNEISRPLEAALKCIREQQRESEPAPVEVKPWIGGLLAGNLPSSASEQLLYSWHKQKEGAVSENDRRILHELEGELGER